MLHIVLYINALIIPVIVAALVIVIVLKREKSLGSFFRDVEIFLFFLFLTAIAYLPLYYDYEIFYLNLGDLTYSIGWDLIWRVYAYVWFILLANELRGVLGKLLSRVATVFFVSFVTSWIIAMAFAATAYNTIMSFFGYLETGILVVCVTLCARAISVAASDERKYCLCGSVLLLVEAGVDTFYMGDNIWLKNVQILIWLLLAVISVLVVLSASRKATLPAGGTLTGKTEEAALNELREEYQLTERETDIYGMLLRGKSNKEISEELFIGEATVKTHIHNLFKKLSVSGRVDAILKVKERQSE